MRTLLTVVLALVLAAPAQANVRPGWSTTGSMSTGHAWAEAVLLDNGKVLLAGGDTPISIGTRTVELYDPATGTWSLAAPMVVSRTALSMVKLANGKVLAAGGWGAGALNTAEVYDPATNTWQLTGPLSLARNRATLTALPNGKAVMAGGEQTGGFTNTADLYDPATNAWTPAGSFVDARIDHSAALLPDGRVLIAGGFNPNFGIYGTAAAYDPATNSWTTLPNMFSARSLFGLTVLPGGRVLGSGGDNSSGRLNTAELITPGAAAAAAPSMAAVHYQHTATALSNGKVLVASGLNAPGDSYGATAELYDPVANRWDSAGNLATPRGQHTATLLQDGRVLVAGGYPGPTPTAELWTPATSLSADPSVAFGDQTTGASTPGAVQVTNTGDSPLLLEGFALGGAQPGEFAVSGARCRVVAPGATCVLDVSFNPAAAGPRSATLTFAANTGTGTHAVSLSGRGVAPTSPPPPPPVTLPQIDVTLSFDYSSATKRATKFTRLVVKKVPAGSTVTATCKKGCARKRYVKKNARGNVSLKPMIAKAVKAGSTIRVTVAHPGMVSDVKTLTARKGKRPKLG